MGRFYGVSQQLRPASLSSRGMAALVILLFLASPLQSQGTASLRGTVSDSQGKLVAGATIHLQLKDSTQTQTVHTDQEGKYIVPAISGGVYFLSAEMAGYSDAEIPAVFIAPNEAKTLDRKSVV